MKSGAQERLAQEFIPWASVFKRILMNPLGLVDVPNMVSALVLPLAKGANIDGVSFGTPPTNS